MRGARPKKRREDALAEVIGICEGPENLADRLTATPVDRVIFIDSWALLIIP